MSSLLKKAVSVICSVEFCCIHTHNIVPQVSSFFVFLRSWNLIKIYIKQVNPYECEMHAGIPEVFQTTLFSLFHIITGLHHWSTILNKTATSFSFAKNFWSKKIFWSNTFHLEPRAAGKTKPAPVSLSHLMLIHLSKSESSWCAFQPYEL